MSGGHFDYNQFKIQYIQADIQEIIEKNGKEKTEDELDMSSEWYEKYPDDKIHAKYSPEVIQRMKEAVYYLKKAHIYAQRIDWFLSGDDGEESFHKRLKEELDD